MSSNHIGGSAWRMSKNSALSQPHSRGTKNHGTVSPSYYNGFSDETFYGSPTVPLKRSEIWPRNDRGYTCSKWVGRILVIVFGLMILASIIVLLVA